MTRAKLIRHGKSSQGLLKHKTAMYEVNARLAQRNDDIAAIYLRQPPRTQCKNCASTLIERPTFVSHGIGYLECPICGHLNGAHEETAAFCDFLYTRDDGKAYAQAYSAEDAAQYQSRVQDIYLPKAAFLSDALAGEGVDFRTCAVADIGAGSGYFVAALQQHGFNPVMGYEVSADQVALGNRMLAGQPLRQYPADATEATLAGLTARVVSLIGVLEHVLSPRAALAATGKPMIISTGMATVAELDETVRAARAAGCNDLVLLKCTSTYPATPENSNLMTLPHLRELFACEVGLSDHTMGLGVSIASVALGATVIEKHFTLRRADGGVDSTFSLEAEEFAQLQVESERAWRALGQVSYGPSEAEKNSLVFRRSLYVVADLRAGEVLSPDNLRVIRPGYGLAPGFFATLLGKRVGRDVKRGTPMSWDLL